MTGRRSTPPAQCRPASRLRRSSAARSAQAGCLPAAGSLRDGLLNQPVQARQSPPAGAPQYPRAWGSPPGGPARAVTCPRPVPPGPRPSAPAATAPVPPWSCRPHRARRISPDTPQRPAQILRREHLLPQAHLQAGDDSILGARRPAATLSCGAQRNSPSPPGSWPASAGWLRSLRPARATPTPPPHPVFGPSRLMSVPSPVLRPLLTSARSAPTLRCGPLARRNDSTTSTRPDLPG